MVQRVDSGRSSWPVVGQGARLDSCSCRAHHADAAIAVGAFSQRCWLAHDLPISVSVAERDGEIVIVLQDGTIVDGALVAAINDLLRDDE